MKNKLEQNKFVHIAQGVLLFVAMTMVAARSDADELSHYLEALFEQQDTAEFLKYESVEQAHAEDFGALRYLVIDFQLNKAFQPQLQLAVHSLCGSVLRDIGLLTELSYQGYNMVSVSFDQKSQYDCL